MNLRIMYMSPILKVRVNRSIRACCYLFLAVGFLCWFSLPEEAFAQRGKRKLRTKRANRRALSVASDYQSSSLDLSSTFGDIIITPATDSDFYDPMTVENFRRLRDTAQPIWNEDDYDEEDMERASQKALSMQAGRTISDLLNKSDLQDFYRDIKKSFRAFQDYFRYSVQDKGDGLVVTKEKKRKGERLLELSLQVNLKKGVDPQLRIGENTRFRYDPFNNGALIEYGFDF